MVLIRALLTALIALSLAFVPVAGEAVIVSKKPVEVMMGDQGDMPCCPCCDTQPASKNHAACAIKCMNLFSAVLPPMISLPEVIDPASPFYLGDSMRGHVRSPPTHPPPA